jgi:hypothetical protein
LGLKPDADSNAIQKAYKKKVSDLKGNEPALAAVEAAHSRIVMSQLTSRLSGQVSIDKNVAFADKGQLFPYRPRFFQADRDIMLYSGIIQCLMLMWGVSSPSTAQTTPVIWSASLAAIANVIKQNRIDPPPPKGYEGDDKKNTGGKNLFRGFLLAFAATFGGCFLFYTLPDLVASIFKVNMPYWFYSGQTMFLCIGASVVNWIMTAFYR